MSDHPSGSAALWDPDFLKTEYVENRRSIPDIAAELGCGEQTVARWLDKHGIETRDPSEAIRDAVGTDHVEFTSNRAGYEIWAATDRVVPVHRLLAVAEHGFDAIRGKHIHHKNEIPWDNRPSNLTPMSPSDHAKHHAQERARQE